jgi:P-type E1-E2 ATPase
LDRGKHEGGSKVIVEIPGRAALDIQTVVFDVNGTLAVDGTLGPGVIERMRQLRARVKVMMLTANTHGKQDEIDAAFGFRAHIITGGGAEKAAIVRELGAEHVIAVGNGANDAAMFEAAALGIAVLGAEGLALQTLLRADAVTAGPLDALDLLLKPDRLRATLRG